MTDLWRFVIPVLVLDSVILALFVLGAIVLDFGLWLIVAAVVAESVISAGVIGWWIYQQQASR